MNWLIRDFSNASSDKELQAIIRAWASNSATQKKRGSNRMKPKNRRKRE